MTSYDPTLNPRYLGEGPTSEDRQDIEARLEMLQQRLAAVSKAASVFHSEGWEVLGVMLRGMVEDAKEALVGLQEIRDVRYVQGQVRAFSWLLALPRSIEHEHRQLRMEIEELEKLLDLGR
jgi:hypothetical protein